MLITAIVCTYNRYDLLEEAISSLIRQDLPDETYRIVVIDNSPDASGSASSSKKWRRIPNLIWRHEPKAGLSHARNVGLKLTKTPLVAFLDDDAVASPRWLEGKIAAFDRLGPTAHIIGGRVRLRFEGERPDWLPEQMLSYLSACDLGEETRLIRPGEWVVGANITYRTDAIITAGGFSTALGRVGGGVMLMSNDEIDLQDRIAARGGATGYTPDAEVEHFVPLSRLTQNWFRRRAAWQAVSDFIRAPDVARTGSSEAWTRSKRFIATCAPADRTIRGLTLFEPEHERFLWQVGALYDTVHAILAGAEEDDEG